VAERVSGRFPVRSILKCRPRRFASSDGSNGMVPISCSDVALQVDETNG